MPASRTKLLHGNPKHAEAEETIFIQRLRYKLPSPTEAPRKTDSINLFKQYLHLYRALEQRLIETSEEHTEFLNVFKSTPWANRSKQLEADIKEMISQLSKTERSFLIDDSFLFPAMSALVTNIQTARPSELFAYLSVRCLGDTFGGQALMSYNTRLFSKYHLTHHFYNSASQQALALSRHVNQAALQEVEDEQTFLDSADRIYASHLQLFEEMEQHRTKTQAMLTTQNPYKNKYAIGLLFAGSAAAVATVYLFNTSTQPKI